MTRSEYFLARRLIRANGNYGLRWVSDEAAMIFRTLDRQPGDTLSERARLRRGNFSARYAVTATVPFRIYAAVIDRDLSFY